MRKFIGFFLFALLPHTVYAKPSRFSGDWAYHIVGCDYEHMGQFSFTSKGRKIHGTWHEGSPQGQGNSGQLKGEIKGNKLWIWRCSDDDSGLYPACPSYEKESARYFIHSPNGLSGYSKHDKQFKKDWVKLHKVRNNTPTPVQKNSCK